MTILKTQSKDGRTVYARVNAKAGTQFLRVKAALDKFAAEREAAMLLDYDFHFTKASASTYEPVTL